MSNTNKTSMMAKSITKSAKSKSKSTVGKKLIDKAIRNLTPEARSLFKKLSQDGVKIFDFDSVDNIDNIDKKKHEIEQICQLLDQAVGRGTLSVPIIVESFGDNRTIYKTLTEPNEKFIKLKEFHDEKLKREQLKQEQQEQQEREDKEYEYWYSQRMHEIASASRRGEIARSANYSFATPAEARQFRFPCAYCSKRFGNEQDKIIHQRSHMLYVAR